MPVVELWVGLRANRRCFCGQKGSNFYWHLLPGVTVTIINADKLKIFPAKLTGKNIFVIPVAGGLRSLDLAEVITKHGIREFCAAILKMLPNNKLRPEIIKKLKFK